MAQNVGGLVPSTSQNIQNIQNIHLMSLQDSDMLDSDVFEISDFLCFPLIPSAKSKCFDKTSNDLSTRKSMARAVGLEISKFESGVWKAKK